MKRRLLTLLLMLIFTAAAGYAAQEPVMEDVQLDLRSYDVIEVPAGTFIPVISAQEISTQYCPVGYKVRFTSTNDLFMHETNIIPENSEFYGYVEQIHEPVVGTNASMVIKINKVILPDGFEMPIRGYIYTPNNNLIGGGISEPASWIKMPHYQSGIGNNTTLQIRPGRERKMGSHTTITSGENRIIILSDSAWITHTLTN
ncbi:TPA: hypothetical protein IAC10_02790 [Candidatus Scatousia excrementigallinarum]|uniref:Uncharacterized protein n=1 Tax=Candidatus Scatousia excrementigallinarum TaxID=2840935 RepID=A0A9D1EX78_9BACT|nr:hypothetical protein [Candidatus Scatousia excrementigallinarum]